MKKCPTCEKTFDDHLKFCQTDGTLLVEVVENAPIEDPYKTTVARPDEIAAAIPPVDPFKTIVGGASNTGESGDLLQLPEEHDPLKTQFVSEKELRKEMESNAPKEDVIDLPPMETETEKSEIPPASGYTPPEPPKFNEPSLKPPSFSDSSVGSEDKTIQVSSDNPFATPPIETSPYNSFGDEPLNRPTGPIPSPFDKGKLVSFEPPATPLPTYKDPEPEPQKEEKNDPFAPTPFGQSAEPNSPFAATPFDKPAEKNDPFAATPFGKASEPTNAPIANSDWTPPAAPEASWQNQPIGQNTPFQPPVAGAGGKNQTLAIVSLVCGILGFCCGILGVVAVVTGFMAKNNADTDPSQYGGRGLAIAGMILGVVGFVLNVIGAIIQFTVLR